MVDVVLNGRDLSPEDIQRLAGEGQVAIDPQARETLLASRAVIDDAVRSRKPVYGVTTGLGSNVDKVLSADELATFSEQTLRGRAQALGDPLPDRIVRAAMIVRLNTILKGAAGVSPAVADMLSVCLNKHLTPVVGESASIGASDLVWGATMGLALTGEGKIRDAGGSIECAAHVLKSAGIKPLTLGPRDGLALASHSSFSAALGALGITDALLALQNVQAAAALSMLGFMANVSPLQDAVLSVCRRSGEDSAAESLRALLSGSTIENLENARRLQDPLSIRNIVQIHGAAYASLDFAHACVSTEINGASDNPVVLQSRNDIVSGGAYHTTQLTIALETVSNALKHLAMAQLARVGKLMSAKLTGLPQFLAMADADATGFAPLMKPAETLAADIVLLAQPAPVWPSGSADGVEDTMAGTAAAGLALLKMVKKMQLLTAIELVVAAQAVEFRGDIACGTKLSAVIKNVRGTVKALDNSRPMIEEINALAMKLQRPLVTNWR